MPVAVLLHGAPKMSRSLRLVVVAPIAVVVTAVGAASGSPSAGRSRNAWGKVGVSSTVNAAARSGSRGSSASHVRHT
jgi:hypothetical protein